MLPHEIAEIAKNRQNSRKNAVFWPGAGPLGIQMQGTFPQLFLGISCPNSRKKFFRVAVPPTMLQQLCVFH